MGKIENTAPQQPQHHSKHSNTAIQHTQQHSNIQFFGFRVKK
jgi:hypothetical protein